MPNEKNSTTTKTTLLALRPGRRELGVAVLEGPDLLFWGVAGFRKYQGEELLKAVEGRLRALIQTYQPQVLAMERPAPTRLAASPALGAILGRIRAVAAQEGLQMRLYRPEEVRAGVCEKGLATHSQVVERMVVRYPHLARCRLNVGQRREDYWRPMFTAVAVGLVGVEEGN